MNIHKRTKLTPHQREEIYRRHHTEHIRVALLAEEYIEAGLKKEAKRYNKSYPGEMLHLDCTRLLLLRGQVNTAPRDYLFVAIDDYSRELYAAILPDKTAASAGSFLGQVLEECAYTIETAYTDNGKKFQGNPEHHAFAELYIRKVSGRSSRARQPPRPMARRNESYGP